MVEKHLLNNKCIVLSYNPSSLSQEPHKHHLHAYRQRVQLHTKPLRMKAPSFCPYRFLLLYIASYCFQRGLCCNTSGIGFHSAFYSFRIVIHPICSRYIIILNSIKIIKSLLQCYFLTLLKRGWPPSSAKENRLYRQYHDYLKCIFILLNTIKLFVKHQNT